MSAAFTLIELILVIVLIGVLAGVTIPRLTSNDRRQAEVEVAAVETFLMAVAERDEFASEPLAVVFDALPPKRSFLAAPSGEPQPQATLSLQVRRRPDPAKPDLPSQWVTDTLVAPVPLVYLALREATSDGLRLDPRAFRVAFTQSEPRPTLSLLFALRQESSSLPGPAWQVDLPQDALSPVRTALGAQSVPHLSVPRTRTIDLDAQGRGNQPW